MAKSKRPLFEYVEALESKNLIKKTNIDGALMNSFINHVSYNSKDVIPNTLFVCKGIHFKEDYLREALTNGAVIYIGEEVQLMDKPDIPYILVHDMRKTLAVLANIYYKEIWKSLKLVGITGTKGKSTTSYYVKSILDLYLLSQNKPLSAILSGIFNYDGIINEESHLTTPETFELHQHFQNSVDSGIEYLTMEVSSQALKYHRTEGVSFSVGVFLNIGHDHISDIEHQSYEDYRDSKLRLFSQCHVALVNSGTPDFNRVINEARAKSPKVLVFGMEEESDIFAYDLVQDEEGTSFKVRSPKYNGEFRVGMKGLFNVENALAAIAVAHEIDIPINFVKDGIELARVPGRMELFYDKSKDLVIIVDYAHNQLSFEKLFETVQIEYKNRPIHIVFGCPGYKALGRRQELGEIAGKYADMVYITEEDAGEEPLANISGEIAQYIQKARTNYEIIDDREEAIKRAIQMAPQNCILLITGKGRETRQKRDSLYIDTLSDVEIVERILSHEE